MPLCISVRFHTVCCDWVICINAVVTMLDTISSSAVANSSSIREKPDSLRTLVTWPSKLCRLQGDDRRLRRQRLAHRRTDGRDHGDLLDAGGRCVDARSRDAGDLPDALVEPRSGRGRAAAE